MGCCASVLDQHVETQDDSPGPPTKAGGNGEDPTRQVSAGYKHRGSALFTKILESAKRNSASEAEQPKPRLGLSYEGCVLAGETSSGISSNNSSIGAYADAGWRDGGLKANQDTALHVFLPKPGVTFAGVFDGHGPSGHRVSEFAAFEVVKTLALAPPVAEVGAGEMSDGLVYAFTHVDSELKKEAGVESSLSGTTAAVVLLSRGGGQLWAAWAGDSRIVKGRAAQGGRSWTAAAISADHKPETPSEFKRLKAAGGTVRVYPDEEGSTEGRTPPRPTHPAHFPASSRSLLTSPRLPARRHWQSRCASSRQTERRLWRPAAPSVTTYSETC